MSKLLGNYSQGLVFVVSAPAGTGKTTLVRLLTSEFSCIVQNISYTTRAPRPGEVSGKDYHFVTVEEFEAKIANNDFLEHVLLYGNYYGTCLDQIRDMQIRGLHSILVIDTQGAERIRSLLKAVFIFIQPPSLDILKKRLLKRGTESIEVIERRLQIAGDEIAAGAAFDYRVINDDLNISYEVLRSIFIAEEHRVAARSEPYP